VKIGTGDVAIVNWFEEHGLRLIDTSVRLVRAPGPLPVPDDRVRFARDSDRDSVVAVASRSFWASRFHLDPRVPARAADALKGAWAGNYFHGERGDWMVVAEDAGRLTGFLLLMKGPGAAVTIDLIAVDPETRGRHLASAMVSFAFANLAEPAFVVGTQIHNASSLRLYHSLGFTIEDAQYVLHGHGG
jgi:ribosomal protein S18 acetylase RimI-like enzyme